MSTPIERYKGLLQSGRFQPDAAQARAAQALDRLYRALKTYRPGPRFFGFGGSSPEEAPKGLYIHGDVGRGKSLLMDLFFESATTAKKRRVHFNAFMVETHARIHEWRGLTPKERARRKEFISEAFVNPIAP